MELNNANIVQVDSFGEEHKDLQKGHEDVAQTSLINLPNNDGTVLQIQPAIKQT